MGSKYLLLPSDCWAVPPDRIVLPQFSLGARDIILSHAGAVNDATNNNKQVTEHFA
jgi:hypothetical protein